MSERPQPVYDPELPFLAELERRIGAHASRSASRRYRAGWRRRPGRATRPDRGTGPAHFSAHRVARRALILAAVLGLIAASAWGTRAVFSTTTNPGSAQPVIVSTGHAGAERWILRVWIREGQLCRQLVVGTEEQSNCAPRPAAASLALDEVDGPLHRYLFGLAGARVSAVHVGAPGSGRATATRPLQGRLAVAGASTRWFVVVVSRPSGEPQPDPSLRPVLDSAAGRLGRPVRASSHVPRPR